jgi:hypothetical protein
MVSPRFSVQSMSDYAKFAIIQQCIQPKFLYTPDMKVKKVIHPWLPSAAYYKKFDKSPDVNVLAFISNLGPNNKPKLLKVGPVCFWP